MLYCNVSQVAICICQSQCCNTTISLNINNTNTNSTILCVNVYCNEKVTTNAVLTYVL